MNSTYAQSENDFDVFNSALMDMVRKYEPDDIILSDADYIVENDEILLTASAVERFGLLGDEFENGLFKVDDVRADEHAVRVEKQISRLIVTSEGKVNSYGASMKAEFEDLHIFQYDDRASAQFAFDQLTNSGISVSFDQVVTAEKLIEQEIEATYTDFSNKSFLSWGAQFVDYRSYVVQMMSQYKTLNDVAVVVLDSGINTSHPLFEGRILSRYGKSFVADESSPTSYEFEDLADHGSHVSGVIVDSTPENVKIIPLKVLNQQGKGYVSYITAAIKYVSSVLMDSYNLDIKVINMSIGVTQGNSSLELETAVKNIYNRGVRMVVSAGNDSVDTSKACPANVKEAVVVSGLTRNVNGLTFGNTYSNYGSTVDFCAPGTSVYSALSRTNTSNYGYMTGTSMAAPHVTAAFALILSNPGFDRYSMDEIEDMLKQNAIDLGDEGFDKYYGYGCINLTDVGESRYGYVNFSSVDEFPSKAFDLTLSYEAPEDATGYKIYYELEKAGTSYTSGIYRSPIRISETTKVTVYAEIEGSDFSKSFETTRIYYFNNIDVKSNFVLEPCESGGSRNFLIKEYRGALTTLNVPSVFEGATIVGVAQSAFNSSKVENLILPVTATLIDERAFYLNTTIKSVKMDFANKNLKIGAYAFYRCTNLEEVNLPDIHEIGEYAFAYCRNLKSLKLFEVESVGLYALSASGLTDIYIGQNVRSIERQSSLSLVRVYGYASTDARRFAYDNGIKFVDLTLSITQNFNSQAFVKRGTTVTLALKFRGYGASGSANVSYSVSNSSEGDEFDKVLTVQFVVQSTKDVYAELTDYYGNKVRSNTITVNAYDSDSDVRALNYNEEKFRVYLGDDLVQNEDLISANKSYELTVVAEAGYFLKSVKLNGVEQLENGETPISKTISLEAGSVGATLTVETEIEGDISVTFNSLHGEVQIVSGHLLGEGTVRNGDTLEFKILPYSGWRVEYVEVGGNVLVPVREENNVKIYRLANITRNTIVDVAFVEGSYTVTVYVGKGGTYTVGDSGNISYSEARTFHVSASEGYKIDFVTVNGRKIKVENNTFVLQNVDENCEVVISFKKTSSIFSSNSVVLAYFIVFLVLFVVFVVAKVVLYFIQKNKKKD